MPNAVEALEIFEKEYNTFKNRAVNARDEYEDWNEELEAREASNAAFSAIVKIIRNGSILGQSLLAGLWKSYINGLHLYQNEAITLMEAVNFASEGKDTDVEYARAMVRVVDTGEKGRDSIFLYIHKREVAKKPVVVTIPETDQEKKLTLVNVSDDEYINPLDTAKLISKLKESTYHWYNLPSDAKRDELLQEIFTGTRAAVKALKASQKQEGAPTTIMYSEREVDKDTMEIEFKTTKFQLKRSEYKRFMKQMKPLLRLE